MRSSDYAQERRMTARAINVPSDVALDFTQKLVGVPEQNINGRAV